MALPTRDELSEKAMDIYQQAMDYVREYHDKHGEDRSYKAPDFRAALEALRFVAQLAGYTGKIEEWPIEEVERQLAKLKLRVVKDKGGNGKAA
jgi:hypothetical protein